MKIVFVNPPLDHRKHYGNFEKVANLVPPLGIGYLASTLIANGFPDVEILDSLPLDYDFDDVRRWLEEKKPRIVGITATVLAASEAALVARIAKEAAPAALVVLGGPHVTTLPEEAMAEGPYDLGALGEAEDTILEVARAVDSGGTPAWRKVAGLVFREEEGGKTVFTPRRDNKQVLDAIPFPARHLYPPLAAYKPVPASWKRFPFAHTLTSRGCPFACGFCDRGVVGFKFRAYSAEKVVEEVEEMIHAHGAREIRFFDDTFTLSRERAVAIAEGILRKGLDFPWTCRTRTDTVDRELLALFRRAGCWQILYGLESGDEKMLKYIDKGTTIEENANAIEAALAVGLRVRGDFIIGAPGETRESIRRTVDFAKKYPIDAATFHLFTPFLGSRFAKDVATEGRLRHRDFDYYRVFVDPKTARLPYVPEGFTQEEILGEIVKAHREFYLRPRFLLRNLFAVRRLSDIKRNWIAFRTAIGFYHN